MADLIQLLIQLSGDKEVYKSLEKINDLKTTLQKEKINLQIAKNSDIDKEIARVRQEILDLQEKAKAGTITIAEKQDLKDLESELAQLRVDAAKANAEIGEMANGINAASSVQKDLTEEARQQVDAERAAADEAARMEENFQAVLNTVGGISTALNEMADAIDFVDSFANGIFDSFSFASGLFSNNIFDTAVNTLTSQVTQYLTGNMDRITSRYDILSTFSQYMRMMGISEADANASMSRINESILGLPIGLDEAAYRLRRYQMFLGDLEQATNFTIGIQRAITAGGASEQMKNQAYNQIERLLTTGSLSTVRQWISLLNGLGVSNQFIAEQLGRPGMGGKELAAALYGKEISAEEFLNAIAELGKGTSDAAKRLDYALQIYKQTLESKESSMEFAFIRGGANTIESINRTLVVETDVSLTGYMDKAKAAVDQAFKDLQAWIDTHPNLFTLNIDALQNLGESFSHFDIGRIGEKSFEYIAEFIDAIGKGLNRFNPRRVENFIAFGATIAGPIAAIAKNAGPLGIAMGVVDRFEGHNWGNLIGLIADNINHIASAASSFLKIFSDNALDHILAFGVTYGPLISAGLRLAAEGVDRFRDALEFLFAFYRTGGIVGILDALGGMATAIGVLTGALAYFHEIRKEKIELHEALGFNEMDADIQYADELHNKLDAITKDADDAMAEAAAKADTASDLLDKIEKLNGVVERSGNAAAARELKSYVDLANDLFPELALNIDETTGALDEHSRAVIANKDAYIEWLTAVAQFEAQSAALREYYKEEIALNRTKAELEADLAQANANYLPALAAYERTRSAIEDHPEWGGGESVYLKPMSLVEQEEYIAGLESKIAQVNADLERNAGLIRISIDMVGKAGQKAKTLEASLDEIALSTNEILSNPPEWATRSATAYEEWYNSVLDAANAQRELNDAQLEFQALSDEEVAAIDAEAEAIDAFTALLDEIIGQYDELKEASASALESMMEGFAELDKIKPTNLNAAQTTMNTNIGRMQEYQAALDKIEDYFLHNDLGEAEKQYWASLLEGGYGNANDIVALANQLHTEFYTNFMETQATVAGYVNQIASQEAGMIMTLEEGAEHAQLAQLSEGELSAMQKAYRQEYLKARGQAIKEFEKGFTTVDGMVTDSGAEIVDILDGVRQMFYQEGDRDGESLAGATNLLSELVTKLYTESYKGLEDATADLQQIMDQFVEDHINEIISAFGEATEEEGNMDEATVDLGNTITEKEPVIAGLAETIHDVGAEANTATTELTAMREALEAIDGMTVSVNVDTVETVSTVRQLWDNPAGGNARPSIMVPYASGGYVEGAYYGYDSVPSILTPGEFVVRRRAAQALGRSFLENINRLDIPGAMDSLLKQALPLPGHFVAYNNSRSYDNHATVNQNIYTNNAAFTYRRASRFVGAL